MGWNEFCFKFPPAKGGVLPPLRGGDPLQGDQVIVVVVVVLVVLVVVFVLVLFVVLVVLFVLVVVQNTPLLLW